MGYLDKPTELQPSADALYFQKRVQEQRRKSMDKENKDSLIDLEEYYQDVMNYQQYAVTYDYSEEKNNARTNFYSKRATESQQIRDDITSMFRGGDDKISDKENDMIAKGIVPSPYFDSDTGKFGFGEGLSWYEAQDQAAWTRENELGLAGEELGSIFNVAQLYMGDESMFQAIGEKNPEFEALFSAGIEEGREAYRHYSLTSSNFGRLAFWKGSYWFETLLEHMPLANIRAAFPDDYDTHFTATTPSKFYASRRHDNWDAEAAYEIFNKYHPGIVTMLEKQGVDKEVLATTPNHFEFRNKVMETLHKAHVNQKLQEVSENGSWYGNTGRFVAGFGMNSLGSVDMVLEIGVAAATWGGSVAFTVGAELAVRGARAAKGVKAATGAARLAQRANFAASMRRNTDFAAKVTGYLPSSWGSTLLGGGGKAIYGSGAAGSGLLTSIIGKKANNFVGARTIDFAEGLVEGALYSTINQVSHSELDWNWDAFWNETLSEAGGQLVAGPIFRGVFRGVGWSLHGVSNGTLGRVYDKLDLTAETRSTIATAFAPVDEKWHTLTREQQSTAMQAKILMGMSYTNWNEMTDSDTGINTVATSVLAELTRAADGKLDVSSLIATVHESRPIDPETGEKVTLSPLEATIGVVDAALKFLDNEGIALTMEQENDLYRTIALGSFAENQILEGKGDVTDVTEWDKQLDALAEMDESERTKILEDVSDAWKTAGEKLGLSRVRIRPGVAERKGITFENLSNDAIQTLRNVFPSMEIDDIAGMDPELIGELHDALSGTEFDSDAIVDEDTPSDVDTSSDDAFLLPPRKDESRRQRKIRERKEGGERGPTKPDPSEPVTLPDPIVGLDLDAAITTAAESTAVDPSEVSTVVDTAEVSTVVDSDPTTGDIDTAADSTTEAALGTDTSPSDLISELSAIIRKENPGITDAEIVEIIDNSTRSGPRCD